MLGKKMLLETDTKFRLPRSAPWLSRAAAWGALLGTVFLGTMTEPLPLRAEPPEPAFTGLRVLPSPGVKNRLPNQGFFYFGRERAVNRPQVTYIFRLRNDSALPLALGRLDLGGADFSTLGLSAFVTPGGPGGPNAPLPTVAPGKQIEVHVTVDLRALGPGALLKRVRLFAVGGIQPVASLYITGGLLPAP